MLEQYLSTALIIEIVLCIRPTALYSHESMSLTRGLGSMTNFRSSKRRAFHRNEKHSEVLEKNNDLSILFVRMQPECEEKVEAVQILEKFT